MKAIREQKRLLASHGQGLLELILAIAVFGMYAASFGTLVLGGFTALTQGGDQTRAQIIAQEGIEAVRAIKDRAWNEIRFGQSDVSINGGVWDFSGEGTTATIDKFTRTILFSDVCRDGSDVIVTCPGSFTDPHTKKVTVTVDWIADSGQTNHVTQTTYLGNWESSDWTQSDWSGGSGQTIWSDTTKYDSDSGNIDTSIPGQIQLQGSAGSACTGQTWPFDTPSNYAFDANKVEVTGGVSQLIAGLPVKTFDWPYTTPSNYTYNPSKIEVTGGVAQLYGASPSGTTSWPFDTPANYTYDTSKIEVTGGLGQLTYIGAGHITQPALASLEFDPNDGDESDIVHLSGNAYAIAYNGPGSDGWIQTVTIASDGSSITPISNYEYDTNNGWEPDIIHISGNVYAIAYRGSGADGFIQTVHIAADGTSISPINNFEYGPYNGYEPSIIHINSTIYAVAYRGPGNDGWIQTLSISDDGTSISSIESYEYDNSQGTDPFLINVAGDIYAIAYEGPGGDGFIQTLTIPPSGVGMSNIQDYEFDTVDANKPFLKQIAGSVYAIVYRGPDADGFIQTVSIPTSGSGVSTIESFEFDPNDAYTPYFFSINGSVYGIAYEGTDGDGFVATVSIPSSGTGMITIDAYEYDPFYGHTQSVIPVSNDVFGIAYSGIGSDGFITTIHISLTDYASDKPTINPNSAFYDSNVAQWTTFTETTNKNGGEIYYQLSDDNGATWMYWDGTSWSTVSGSTDYNTASQINTEIASFPATSQQITFKAFLASDGSQQVQLDTVEIGFDNISYGYPTDRPTIVPTSQLSLPSLDSWVGFEETATKNGGEIYFQLSPNNGSTWYFWNGSSWATVVGTNDYNTASTINTNLASYPFTQLVARAFLESDGVQLVQLDNVRISYQLQAPDVNTVGQWHFDDVSGNFLDSTSNHNDLTSYGTPSYSQTGYFDSAVYFDGNNTYGEITDAAQTGLDVTSALTIDMWINRDTANNSYLVRKWTSGSDQSYRLFVLTDGTLGFQVHNGGNISYISSASNTIQTNQWYHIAAVYDGSFIRLFVNGNSVSAAVSHPYGISNGNAPFTISGDGTLGFIGRIDEVRVSNVARWASNFTPPSSPYGDAGGYPTDHPTINPSSAYNPSSVDAWTGFSETATKNGGEIYYQLSDDGGSTWQYWDGVSWTTAINATDYNTALEIDTNLASFPTDNNSILFKAFFESNGTQQIQLDDVSIGCSNFQFEVGTVSTDEQWTTVTTTNTYTKPVIVASYYESANTLPASVRLDNVTSSSFDIRLQNPSDANLQPDQISYMVIEEGTWTIGSYQIEAHTYDTSTVGSSVGSWAYDIQAYTNTYASAPIVLHQVQTNNDTSWITTYVSSSGGINNPPGVADFGIGLNGAEATGTHGTETIGWVAIEANQTGSVNSVDFESAQTSDSIRGHDSGSGCFTSSYLNTYSNPPIVIAAQQKMDGPEGGWSVQCSNSVTDVGTHIEEDQVQDSERRHTTEIIAYLAFSDIVSMSNGGSGGGYPTSGELISSAYSMNDASPVQVISWDELIPICSPTCTVQIQIKTAPDVGGVPGTWTPTWSGPDGNDSDETDYFTTSTGELSNIDLNGNQWVKYKVTLTSDGNSTPVLNEIRVNYK